MDVHCTTCGEAWDVYHLRHEAIFETGLSEQEARAWSSLPRKQRLAPRYRQEFGAAGWQFGASVIDVLHCPCCPKGAQPDPGQAEVKGALAEILGEDEDGLAAMLDDFGL